MKSDKKRKYLILAVIAIVAIAASWIILFAVNPVNGSFSVSDNEVIKIEEGTSEENEAEADEDLSEEDVSEVVAEDTAEKSTMDERLKEVEGKYPGPETGYIFVGDSRFVNMNDVCGISKRDNLFMVAKVGEGYSWFNDTALQQIKRITSSSLFDKWKLIICLGINDLGNIGKYVEKYESLKDDYDITLVSVNPVNNYGSLTNEQIEKFNSVLTELPFPYIDTYRLLLSTGYATTDGLHYSGDTTRKIYNGILLGLEELTPGSLTDKEEGILDSASLNKKKSIQSDILAQNKYVKKPPEPDMEIDEEKMQELLNSLMQNNGQIPGTEENVEGNGDAAAPQEEVNPEEQQQEEQAEEEPEENREEENREEEREEEQEEHREEEHEEEQREEEHHDEEE